MFRAACHPYRHLWFAVVLLGLISCAPRDPITPTPVSQAWERQGQGTTVPVAAGSEEEPVSTPPIATVDGYPIARHRLVDLLLRSHGPGVLEQLVVLDAAARLAAQKGVRVSRAEVDREYELALRRLTDPLASITTGPTGDRDPQAGSLAPEDREAAERVLESVLSERNISREEFLLTMRRNTYLRRLVESQQVFTEEQLRAEFERSYGKRVRVRLIQLATPGGATRAQEQLAAGQAFAKLAGTYSANLASARNGGLLEPFSKADDEVPPPLREAAFSLKPGEVSDVIRVGRWYHILKLEEILPAEECDYAAVHDDLERRLRERLTEPAMRELYENLFRDAGIEIHDPILHKAFERKHPNRAR